MFLYCAGPICDVVTWSSSASVTWTIPGADNVDPSIAVMQETSFTQGQSFPMGNTDIVYSATDSDGNRIQDSITVTVLGNTIINPSK